MVPGVLWFAVVDQRWAALNQVSELRRNVVAASLIESLVGGLDEFSQAGFAAFAERWRRYDALAGRKIVIQGTEVAGVARGVDPGGALLIETAAGLQAVNAGEVSVRTQ